jgi:SAM-dependent methyltransferase
MATTDSLIEKYHLAASTQGERRVETEFEARFDRVDYKFVALVLGELLAETGAKGGFTAEVVHTINTIRTDKVQGESQNTVRQLVWQRTFVDKTKRESNYYSKSPLSPPVWVRPSPGVPQYKVVLSEEAPIDEFSPNGVRFRVKNRVSFEVAKADSVLTRALQGWRVDVTIVSEATEAAASSLKVTTDRLFGLAPGSAVQTPENILQVLGLAAESDLSESSRQSNRQLYKYEVELEYVGKPENLTAAGLQVAVNTVLQQFTAGFQIQTQMQSELHDVAAHLNDSPDRLLKFASGEWGVKELTPQAIPPTRGKYAEFYPPVGYWLTDKAHGIHALAVVRNSRLVVIAPGLEYTEGGDTPIVERYFADVGTPTLQQAVAVPAPKNGAAKAVALTIVDGEMAPVAGADGKPVYTFLAFDVIAVRGDVVAPRPFEERHKELANAVEVLALFGLPALAKPFIHLDSPDPKILSAQFTSMYKRPARRYENDGLVLYGEGERYSVTAIYKWKPKEENTFDFLARRCPEALLGRLPYAVLPGRVLYFLFVGINRNMMNRFGMSFCDGYNKLFPAQGRRENNGLTPIQFQPSDQPYAYLYYHPADGPDIEGSVVELRVRDDGGDGTPLLGPAPDWELTRIRTDRAEDAKMGRSYGNSYRTAEGNWVNYRTPLTFEMLSEGPGGGYFAGSKAGMYTAPTNFISSAKSELMAAVLAGLNMIVDLGAGKGQDLNRYRVNRVGAVVMVDNSPDALAELVQRKYAGRALTNQKGNGAACTRLHILKGDFTDPHNGLAAKIHSIPGFPEAGGDAVVSNLAAHYAFGTTENMVNFVMLVRGLLRPGGRAVFTLLDGRRVLDLFNKYDIAEGDSWDVREGGVLKYSIKRYFPEKAKLENAGQKIGVLLPFSQGKYYEEYLSNVGALSAVFERRGFRSTDNRGLWTAYGKNFEYQKTNFAALTPGDLEWLSLFVVVQYLRKEI